MIEAVIERCAGIDVGKKFLIVCVMTGPLDVEPKIEIRKFGTIVSELELLRDWLVHEGCSHAVMESTGSYWKPVFNILEDSVEVVLANAYDVQNRRGHKTDPNDSRWLAHLLRHAMIRPSFIPERAIRELRDLTRRRRQLVGETVRERNRIQKVLEDANIKLGDVLSDVLGPSGRLMINALLEGVLPVEEIAQFAQRKAKQKIPELIAALRRNRLTDHHRFVLRHALRHLDFLEKEIEALNVELAPSNFLLLDEPTNHLDMRAKDMLLEALRTYTGTIVFVSHDRYFIDNLATRVFEIEDGHVHIYPGNYEDYLWRKEGGPETLLQAQTAQIAPGSLEEKAPEPVVAAVTVDSKKRTNPMKLKKLQDRMREVEQQVATLESEIAQHEAALAEFKSMEETMRLTGLVAERRKDLEARVAEWEGLSADLE